MASDEICVACYSLVGAGPLVDPHLQLTRVKGSTQEHLFQCTACDARWEFGRLGWGRADPEGA